jgi:hypothetical protein
MLAAIVLLAVASVAGGPARTRTSRTRSGRQIDMPPDGYLPIAEGRIGKLAHLRTLQHIYAAESAARAAAATAAIERIQPSATARASVIASTELSELHTLLLAAGFRPLVARDLSLANALNRGYLWRLSLAVRMTDHDPLLATDFGASDPTTSRLYGGRAVIWCRGYGSETSSGRLILPKVDYLQAAGVQRLAAALALAILRVRVRILAACERVAGRLRGALAGVVRMVGSARAADPGAGAGGGGRVEGASAGGVEHALADEGEPRNAQRLPLSRYGSWLEVASADELLSPFLSSPPQAARPEAEAAAPDGAPGRADARKPRIPIGRQIVAALRGPGAADAGAASAGSAGASAPRDFVGAASRVITRVAIADVLDGSRPATSLCAHAVLSEPTFDELVSIWRPLPPRPRPRIGWLSLRVPRFAYVIADHFELTGRMPPRKGPSRRDSRSVDPPPSARPCELRLFNGVPLANFAAVLPGNLLVFRPADALRLDLVTLVSLLALLLGQRLSAASRFVLLSLWLLRTLFNYRNALVRYDLLVNRFLTSRLSARGVGVMRYLRGEAAAQSALRASLLLSWLLTRAGSSTSLGALRTDGPRMLHSIVGCEHAVRFDTDATARELQRLGLVTIGSDGRVLLATAPAQLPSRLSAHWQRLLELDGAGASPPALSCGPAGSCQCAGVDPQQSADGIPARASTLSSALSMPSTVPVDGAQHAAPAGAGAGRASRVAVRATAVSQREDPGALGLPDLSNPWAEQM